MKWLVFIGFFGWGGFPPGLFAGHLNRGGNPAAAGNLSVGKTRIAVETAATAWQRARGLSGRAGLDQDSGMLFLYQTPARHGFWMKGMKFPLDFIWVSGDRVVEITENVPAPKPGEAPLKLTPKVEVDKVLEVGSGFAAKHQIKVGDKVEY